MKILTLLGVIAAALLTRATLAQEVSLQADSAILSGPFVLTNGYLYQPLSTGLTDGGRALFRFSITNAGSYVIRAAVNAQSPQANSLCINIDAEPQAPKMIWDLAGTAGFEQRFVSWRGNGNVSSPQFSPQVFKLSAGAHQIVVRGRDAKTQLQSLAILQLPAPPTNLHIVSGP